ncbi:DUF2603 domain-containing protein [Helicobacter sp. T3_23-1056]
MATSNKITLADFFDSENFIKASKISNTQILLNIQKSAQTSAKSTQAKSTNPSEPEDEQKAVFNNKEPWWIQDEEGEQYLLLPHSVLKKVLSALEGINEEKLLLELGRDVIQSAPIDFDDVMAVAIDRIESKRRNDGSLPPHINTKSIISEIKKSHPNLFFNFDANFLRKHF